MGAKNGNRRNFENGILTDELELLLSLENSSTMSGVVISAQNAPARYIARIVRSEIRRLIELSGSEEHLDLSFPTLNYSSNCGGTERLPQFILHCRQNRRRIVIVSDNKT